MPALTKQTSKGQAVVEAVDVCGYAYASVTLAGKYLCQGKVLPLSRPISGRLDLTHSIGKLALTADEARTVQAAIDALDAVLLTRPDRQAADAAEARFAAARSAATQTEALRDERRDLVSDIRSAEETADTAFARYHAREDERAWTTKPSYEAKIDAAREALRAFDLAHPEIVAAIRAEKAELAARHAWD